MMIDFYKEISKNISAEDLSCYKYELKDLCKKLEDALKQLLIEDVKSMEIKEWIKINRITL